MIGNVNHTAQFNTSAKSYDNDFTQSKIGITQRNRVYHWLNYIGFFSSKRKVFEINCGTGFDAEQFHQKGHNTFATDASPSMIQYAKENRSSNINFEVQSFEKVAQNSKLTNCDTLFSNFGGLNCIDTEKLTSFISGVHSFQKKEDQLIFVMMSKHCLMESLYFLIKFDFNKIKRRNTSAGLAVKVKDEQVVTYYYTPKEIKELLTDKYTIVLTKPISFFLPPSYLEPFFQKRTSLLSFLNKLEVIFGKFNFMAKWADHYIIVAKKK